MILMVWGEKNIKTNTLKYGMSFNDPIFNELGFKSGDNIKAVDGKEIVEFTDAIKKLLIVFYFILN